MTEHLLSSAQHRAFLVADSHAQFDFFDRSMRAEGGFHVLDFEGNPLPSGVQELHTTTRLVHSYALGQIAGRAGCDRFVDHGLAYLRTHHHDAEHGGYLWSLNGEQVQDGRKLAYGHVFVLLAASSALAAGHPEAQALLDDVDQVLDTHFWEEDRGLFCDEWNRDWTPFSTYRGMNANMHGVEALLAAYEATGREKYLTRAGRILDFFIGRVGPAEGWRLPEHYTSDWQIDRAYSENPMFRPAGTTPGHSFEMARLLLQYGELVNDGGGERVQTAREIVYKTLSDAWDTERGGFFYTLDFTGSPAIRDRYWWPVTEAIGALAALIKTGPEDSDHDWYQTLWTTAQALFIDKTHGGWFPEIDAADAPTAQQFQGKPDIYHSIQATLFPMLPRVSGAYAELNGILKDPAHA